MRSFNSLAASESAKNDRWAYYTDVSAHICSCKETFELSVSSLGRKQLGNCTCICAYSTGGVCIRTHVSDNTYVTVMENVTSASKVTSNLVLKIRIWEVGTQVVLDDDTTNPSRQSTKVATKLLVKQLF